jgi:membrane-bound serine protease (ClpP class)
MEGERSMRRRARVLWVLMAALASSLSAEAVEVVRLRVADTIQPASRRYIVRGLAEAEKLGASLVVMELDTPGGLLDTTREITTAITQSKVPVVVFVTPGGARAASAGFFILLSADVTAMSPGTNTGAAHPVGGKGEDLAEDMRDKATNDTAAMVRAIASQRGRNPEVAAKAVQESTSFTAEEAKAAGLVDLVAADLPALLAELDGRQVTRFDKSTQALALAGATVVSVDPTQAERFLSVLANPTIAYLLMALGMLGIYVEITHPGAVLPGVVGVISILLALFSLSILPVNLAGVALIVFALVLFLLEVKVTSYGLLTVGGIVSFVLGSLMLFDAPIPDMRVSLAVILPTALVMATLTGFLLSRVLRVHKRPPLTGQEGMVGEIGYAASDLAPEGKVKVHGEWWNARARGGPVSAGASVRVVAVGERSLEVEAVATTSEGSTT